RPAHTVPDAEFVPAGSVEKAKADRLPLPAQVRPEGHAGQPGLEAVWRPGRITLQLQTSAGPIRVATGELELVAPTIGVNALLAGAGPEVPPGDGGRIDAPVDDREPSVRGEADQVTAVEVVQPALSRRHVPGVDLGASVVGRVAVVGVGGQGRAVRGKREAD